MNLICLLFYLKLLEFFKVKKLFKFWCWYYKFKRIYLIDKFYDYKIFIVMIIVVKYFKSKIYDKWFIFVFY